MSDAGPSSKKSYSSQVHLYMGNFLLPALVSLGKSYLELILGIFCCETGLWLVQDTQGSSQQAGAVPVLKPGQSTLQWSQARPQVTLACANA